MYPVDATADAAHGGRHRKTSPGCTRPSARRGNALAELAVEEVGVCAVVQASKLSTTSEHIGPNQSQSIRINRPAARRKEKIE